MNEFSHKVGDRLRYFMNQKIYRIKDIVIFPFKAVLEDEEGNQTEVISKSSFGTFFNKLKP